MNDEHNLNEYLKAFQRWSLKEHPEMHVIRVLKMSKAMKKVCIKMKTECDVCGSDLKTIGVKTVLLTVCIDKYCNTNKGIEDD